MRKFTKILVTMLIILSTLGCNNRQERKIYHEKDSKNYSYQDDDLLWHYFIYNHLLGTYQETTSAEPAISLDNTTVSYESVQESTQSEMTESTGEDVGGSESSYDSDSSDSSGMSESSGSDAGGFDGGGGDYGGGDGGGGE